MIVLIDLMVLLGSIVPENENPQASYKFPHGMDKERDLK